MRIVMRAKCDRSRHVVATLSMDAASGYVAGLAEVALTGYGNKFALNPASYPIDGPADDPEVWTRFAGCACGHQFAIDSVMLRQTAERGQTVIVLTPFERVV
jgi:hypothetical protein